MRGERAFTAAYDGQMALDADELQYELGYGPCLDAGRANQVFLIDDMRSEDRWPTYPREVVGHGIGGSLSVPLPLQSATIGALNSYSSRPHAFGADEVAMGEEVATWVSLAVTRAEASDLTSRELQDMKTAMLSRSTIEQAKGVLVERYKITPDQAFTLLGRLADHQHQAARGRRRAGPHRGPARLARRPLSGARPGCRRRTRPGAALSLLAW